MDFKTTKELRMVENKFLNIMLVVSICLIIYTFIFKILKNQSEKCYDYEYEMYLAKFIIICFELDAF